MALSLLACLLLGLQLGLLLHALLLRLLFGLALCLQPGLLLSLPLFLLLPLLEALLLFSRAWRLLLGLRGVCRQRPWLLPLRHLPFPLACSLSVPSRGELLSQLLRGLWHGPGRLHGGGDGRGGRNRHGGAVLRPAGLRWLVSGAWPVVAQ